MAEATGSTGQPAGERRDGRQRVVIEAVSPAVDEGRFPVKRVVGEEVAVEADCFADGHDEVQAELLYRHESEPDWRTTRLEPLGNDRFRASFPVERLGTYHYTVEAWIDPFSTWRHDLEKRRDAGTATEVDLEIGAAMVRSAAQSAESRNAQVLAKLADQLEEGEGWEKRLDFALDPELAALLARHGDRGRRERGSRHSPEIPVLVERPRARFGAWYELFPRSLVKSGTRGESNKKKQGTLRDLEERLDSVARMGFDVLYLPPVHPIGTTHRKGPNNNPEGAPGDVGSPWAIGSKEGGHTSIDPDLGTLEDFHHLIKGAAERGLEVALDIAFQCSPDHPWIAEHPEWFKKRPDGTIQYAENPPKKYEDIVPFDFGSDAWWELWQALKGVFEFWIDQGVKIFRVDNPHTKPFAFWEWVLRELRHRDPELIFLAEAFTRPKVMYRLAKLGFSQSYNYFPWRNNKGELTQYFGELTKAPVVDFLRPNLWPNTPDILTERLQVGGRPAFAQRFILAATLGASYGIYGPAFELLEHVPREAGSEEYRDSEKYQIRHWDLDRADSLAPLITRINAIRHQYPALGLDRTLAFHPTDNDQLLAYSKVDPDSSNALLVVVNLDPFHTQRGFVDLPLARFGLDGDTAFQVHDLLTDARYLWQGGRNFIELDPHDLPAHIFRIRRKVRSERDFDYFA